MKVALAPCPWVELRWDGRLHAGNDRAGFSGNTGKMPVLRFDGEDFHGFGAAFEGGGAEGAEMKGAGGIGG